MITAKKIYADLIVDFFKEKGITHVFDLSGGMIAYLEDSISRSDGICCFPMHHEQAAGFAAEGYARASENFGLAIATSGPGATNLITAIGSSYFDSIPTFFIVGHVHTDNIKKNEEIRQEGFQETDIVKVVQPLTKYSKLITSVDEIIYELEKAHFIMTSGRPGSVLLNIPINLQRTPAEDLNVKHFIGSVEHQSMLDEQNKNEIESEEVSIKLNKLGELLRESVAPVVIVGNGIRLSKTIDQLNGFVKKNNLPVVTSLLGLDSFPAEEGLVGYIGTNGNRDSNIVFANADLIIALGTRLDIRQTGDVKFFNKQAKIVQVDIDAATIDYSIKTELSFNMNLVDFFNVSKGIETSSKPKWLSFVNSVKKEFGRDIKYSNDGIDPNTFIRELSLAAKEGTLIIADVGQNQMWSAQSWLVKKGQRLLYSGGMGAMGFSLPAAIGAWCASPNSEVIVICGDGGLQINIQEMETVTRNNIPLKLFILNNKSLGMVKEFQDIYLNSNYQSTRVGYGCPDLEKIARAYGFEYEAIKSCDKDDSLIKKILNMNKPVLVEVDIPMDAALEPKVVYGHSLDDQAPYLDEGRKKILEDLKADLKSDK